MKKLLILIFGGILVLNLGCNKKDNQYNGDFVDAVKISLASGKWKVNSLIKDGNNSTSTFAGYTLTFGTDGILTVEKSPEIYSGFWSTVIASGNGAEVSIAIGSPVVGMLRNEWLVTNNTSFKITMIHRNTGTSDDELILEKL